MKLTFSIIIPTYNQANFLKKAIQSVINQTFKDWELIVIDNFSNDNTVDVVNSFENENILFFQINNNGIIAKSRNKGIIESRGSYIAFLDSDDFWYSNKLEVINEIIKNSGKEFICHSEIWTYLDESKKSHVINYGPKHKSKYFKLLFNGNCISTSAVVVSKNILLKSGFFNESEKLITAEDYDLWLKIADIKTDMEFTNIVLGEYLIHSQSNSNASEKNMNAILECFYNHYVRKNYNGIYYSILKKRRVSIKEISSLENEE